MEGNEKIIEHLNARLAEELTTMLLPSLFTTWLNTDEVLALKLVSPL